MKDELYDMFCNSIDDNFVDIYAACMTMYFAKFNTYTAAGLLTFLLKWIVLDKYNNNNKKKKDWIIVPLDKKIEFLRDYKNNYKTYISNKNNKDNSSKNKNIRFFFEKIDDKNLNDKQKKDLANLLKKVITFKKESNIFYLVEGIKNEIVGKSNANLSLDINIKDIIAFYEGCVKNDFKNFIALDKKNCKYADVIKYVLCYGSCLNYNGGNEGGMNVDYILNQLNLKANIKSKDEEFLRKLIM